MIDSFKGKYFFLSNFYPGDKTSLEHKFQAAKTLNPIEKLEIMEASTPGKAKRLGKKVELRPNWDEAIKVLVMWTLLEKKFSAPMLQEWLLATGEEVLLEGNNWHDNFWGDCGCDRIKCLETPGHNILGVMLMGLRKKLGNQ